MKTIPAGEAKNKFGVLMDTAQREAVAISKKGRTAAIVVPVQEYEEYQGLKLERLRREVQIGLDQIGRGDVSDGEAFFDDAIVVARILHPAMDREKGLKR